MKTTVTEHAASNLSQDAQKLLVRLRAAIECEWQSGGMRQITLLDLTMAYQFIHGMTHNLADTDRIERLEALARKDPKRCVCIRAPQTVRMSIDTHFAIEAKLASMEAAENEGAASQ